MTIQEYSKLIALVAKVETKKQVYNDKKDALNAIDSTNDPDAWLEAYDNYKKAQNGVKAAYKEFRKNIETEEYRYLAHEFTCSLDKSDSRFFWCVRYEILREAKHVEFTTGE